MYNLSNSEAKMEIPAENSGQTPWESAGVLCNLLTAMR